MISKLNIITITDYRSYFPDEYGNKTSAITITSAINQSELELDGITGGRLRTCWNETDTSSVNYLTENQRAYVQYAMLLETQHILNNFADFSQGNTSFTQGGTTLSDNRPKRDRVPYEVLLQLQNAGLYVISKYNEMNLFGDKYQSSSSSSSSTSTNPNDYITYMIGDSRYITTYQNQIPKGYIPYIGENYYVNWTDINNLIGEDVIVQGAKKVLDSDGNYRYAFNLLKWEDYTTTDELIDIVNEAKTAREWESTFNYSKYANVIATYTGEDTDKFENGKTYQFSSTIDNNLGNSPFMFFDLWQSISVSIDYDKIEEDLDPIIDEKIDNKITEIPNQYSPFKDGVIILSDTNPSTDAFTYEEVLIPKVDIETRYYYKKPKITNSIKPEMAQCNFTYTTQEIDSVLDFSNMLLSGYACFKLGASNLVKIDIYQNSLNYIDVGDILSLQELYCETNLLEELDLTKNTNLIFCDASNNELIKLYLPPQIIQVLNWSENLNLNDIFSPAMEGEQLTDAGGSYPIKTINVHLKVGSTFKMGAYTGITWNYLYDYDSYVKGEE